MEPQPVRRGREVAPAAPWASWLAIRRGRRSACCALPVALPALRYTRVPRTPPVFAMRNPLQDQLLKAGLAKKSQVADALREQKRKRKGKAPSPQEEVDVERLRAEKAERDRALAAERNAKAREQELRAQVRQIIQDHRVARDGEIPYRFTDGSRIRTVYVDAAQRTQLARGGLVIVRAGEDYELLPRTAGMKVAERDPALLVLDNAAVEEPASSDADDEYYSRFKVPDDLVW